MHKSLLFVFVMLVAVVIIAASCAGTLLQTTTASLPMTSTTASTTQSITTAQTTGASTGVTPATTSATTTTTTTEKPALTPVPGAEFPKIPIEYDKWTIIHFHYDVVHESGTDYHFPWTLTIRNDTESDLELTAYLIHWGFHNWVGYVSRTDFSLNAGETKTVTGEDILGEAFVENMVYLEDIQIEVYLIEQQQ